MTKKINFDSKKYVGATAEDCKMIHLAFSKGSKLTIDENGRIFDDSGRWIADGKERA